MTQYNDYSNIPQAVRDIVANKCHLLDQYVIMQTGEYRYSAQIYNPVTKECVQYDFTRGGGYNSSYTVNSYETSFDYQYSNEYYCYSNLGFGSALDLPVYEGVPAHASAFLVSVLAFAILFKGVLFKCLRKKSFR